MSRVVRYAAALRDDFYLQEKSENECKLEFIKAKRLCPSCITLHKARLMIRVVKRAPAMVRRTMSSDELQYESTPGS
jgi:hypothetical protein